MQFLVFVIKCIFLLTPFVNEYMIAYMENILRNIETRVAGLESDIPAWYVEAHRKIDDIKIQMDLLKHHTRQTLECNDYKQALEDLLKHLKDEGIVVDWYYNGEYKYRLDSSLLEEVNTLRRKIIAFETGNEICWQGDMDKTISQNLELKQKNRDLLQENEKLKKRIERIGMILTR